MAATVAHKGIWITSVIWLICIAAALLASYFRASNILAILPIAAIASVPAFMSLILSPYLRREWAQILVIFSWIALAIFACLAIAFIPMAVLFLCAPAIAALFEKEKVIEAMIIAAIAAAGLFYFTQYGDGLDMTHASSEQINWGINTAIASTIGLMIAALYGVSATRNSADIDVSSELLEAVPGGLLRVNADNQIELVTPLAKTQLGIPLDQGHLTLMNVFEDKDNENDLKFIIDKARETGRQISRKFKLKRDSGAMRAAEITAAPLGNQGVLLHVYDSTAHEARVNSLHQAFATAQEDSDGKSLFFAGVSHELRTPLNAIIGFSDMMRSRLFGPLPNKYAEYADLIHDSGQHMLDLIGDVLDLSKVEAGKYDLTYHSFDAADVIRSSVKMLRPAADSAEIQLDVEILGEQGELLVDADRKALRQIALNLLSNAIKFTPKGGRVLIRGSVEGDTLTMGVVDNGAGMTAEELKSVGKPYVQSDSGKTSQSRGSGLGLTLVKSLAEVHEGEFTLCSQKGVGTTAEVKIPIQRA